MSDAELLKAVQDIAFYLGAKAPDPKLAAVWHPKVKHIPSSAVPYIVERITDECDRMPNNPAKLFRALYAEWQTQHPQQVKQQQAQGDGCPHCYDGILWLVRDKETSAIYCTCYCGNPGNVGRSSLEVMEQQGWTLRKLQNDSAINTRIQTLAEGYSRAAQHGSVFPDPQIFDGYDGPVEQRVRCKTDGLRHPFGEHDRKITIP